MGRTIVILGGGPCGLAAALEAIDRGVRPIVLEAGSDVGGLSRTVEVDGFRFDLGGHRFVSGNAALMSEIEELLGGDALLRERTSAIHLRGRRFEYPLRLSNVLTGIEPWLGIRIVADYLAARRRARSADRTFAEWVTSRFGRTLYRLFFEGYTRKLWGIEPTELSADWAGQRITIPDLSEVVRRLLRSSAGEPRTYARRYLYPRLGIGQIYSRMAQRIVAGGGAIRTGHRVVGLEGDGGRIRRVDCDGPGGPTAIAGQAVLSTIPLPDLYRMLPAGRHPAADRAADRLRFRAMRFLDLPLDRPRIGRETWIYLPEARYLATRVQEPTHRSPEMAPPGKTSLMLEIPCTVGDAVWSATDGQLLARCRRDLGAIGIDLAGSVRTAFSVRAAHAYPIYHLGYRSDRDRVLAAVAGFPNLATAGRQGRFRYLWMDQAILMGRAAAAALLGVEPARRPEAIGLEDVYAEGTNVLG